jgi:hypothetical protein
VVRLSENVADDLLVWRTGLGLGRAVRPPSVQEAMVSDQTRETAPRTVT